MEVREELNNFIKVWILATASLCYCYYLTSRLPKGIIRLLSLFPVFYLFIILPLNLTSFHLCGPTTFFLIWLANFKLLLFSFDQGPLFSPPPQNLFHFIFLTCLPIKLKNNKNPSPNPYHSTKRSLLLAIKAFLLAILVYSFNYRYFMHPYVILALYCLNVYVELEVVLAISAIPARVVGLELGPQFDEPYLATSLQDFWGRRWNLMVTSILRPTVYYPVGQLSIRLFGPALWSQLSAVIATFVVSGLMHEIMYFYITRASPTWEVTWFFVLHGVCVAVEVAVKKMVKDRWRLHRAISGPLTVIFAAVTGVWLFFPQLIRNRVDEKAISEFNFLVNFAMQKLSFLL